GFESSSEEDISEGEGIILDQIPTLPDDKTLRKKLAGVAKTGSEQPGVIYVGRVPHGFYEHQMRAYFSQFGDIRRLRLSRNRKTGHSKHYAFIEFASSDVAQIVADTMNKYLMFGHILQVRTIPTAQVLEHLFKGANSRFKPVPRNKIEARKPRLGTDREGWEKRSEREKKRRESKAEKLKALGYEYEAPSLRSAKDVLTKGADENGAAQVEAAKEEEVVQALPEPATQEPATETRSLTVVQTEPHSVTVTEQVTIKKAKKDAGKVKKGKKTKTAAA
ncbi:nucleolar protein, partial [Cryomyces antarcticus]